MIRLNIRKKDSTIHFGTPTWMDDNEEPLPVDTVLRMLENARVLVLVHGYNVTEAMDAFNRVAHNVEDLYDVIVGLTWPGSKMGIGYWFAEHRADQAGKVFAQLFGGLPHRVLDVEGHSCGCRVALEAIKNGLKVRNLILAAAATDNQTVHIGERYGQCLNDNVETVVVMHSRNDGVLKRLFKLSSWLKRAARLRIFGDDCCALGYTGPQDPTLCPPNLKAIDLTGRIVEHSQYKKHADVYREWRALIKE